MCFSRIKFFALVTVTTGVLAYVVATARSQMNHAATDKDGRLVSIADRYEPVNDVVIEDIEIQTKKRSLSTDDVTVSTVSESDGLNSEKQALRPTLQNL